MILHVPPCGPCGSGTSLHEKFLTECHSEFAPCFQHCECWGWKLWNQPTGHIPKCAPKSWSRKPTFCPFSFLTKTSELFVIFLCHKNDFDVLILTWRQSYVAICVCGKGNYNEDDIYVMKDWMLIKISKYLFSCFMLASWEMWPNN